MPIHTIKFDRETLKVIKEILTELKKLKNMNQERKNPSGRYSSKPRHTPPPYKKR